MSQERREALFICLIIVICATARIPVPAEPHENKVVAHYKVMVDCVPQEDQIVINSSGRCQR